MDVKYFGFGPLKLKELKRVRLQGDCEGKEGIDQSLFYNSSIYSDLPTLFTPQHDTVEWCEVRGSNPR